MYNRLLTPRLICSAFILTFFFSSCSYKQTQVLFENGTPAAVKDSAAVNNKPYVYRIAPQDILQIRNLQSLKLLVDETDASGGSSGVAAGGSAATPNNYQVEEDGSVALPVLGRVKVAGLTRAEAAKKIQDMYGENLLKNPIIDLKIVNLKVTLLGEVRTPGNYPLVTDKTNLIDLIGQAGGLTEKANEKQVKIIRGGTDNPQVILVNLNDIKTVSNPAIIMQNKDVVYIAQNKRAIRNDKLQDFSTLMQPGLLLLNTALIIYTITRK